MELYKNFDIAPSKGNLFSNVNPNSIEYQFSDQYSIDDFYPGKLVDLRDPYIVRDFRGQTVIAYPFQYNPVQKVFFGGLGAQPGGVTQQEAAE